MQTKTLQNFTMETVFTAADFEDLGEAGVINEALKGFFAASTYETNGMDYDIDKVVSLETKILLQSRKVVVLLYGQAEIAGL